ncbi:hypothetical protein PsasTeo6_16744 [Pseudomonas asiatica]|nr:hypothetical protein PsasTeo6_16744 [Pseudomonas asiatica]
MVFQGNFKPIFFIIFQHDKLSIQITPASQGMGRALRSATSEKLLTVQPKKFSPQIYSPTPALIA